MSKIIFAKMQLLQALQQKNLKQAEILTKFIAQNDPKAKQSKTYSELSKYVPIAVKVEDIQNKLEQYYEQNGLENPYVEYQEQHCDQDGYESFDSKQQFSDPQEVDDDDAVDIEVEGDQQQQQQQSQGEEKVAPPITTPSLSTVSSTQATSIKTNNSHSHHHNCSKHH